MTQLPDRPEWGESQSARDPHPKGVRTPCGVSYTHDTAAALLAVDNSLDRRSIKQTTTQQHIYLSIYDTRHYADWQKDKQ